MGNFEQWFADQDFYTNMRFIHGDNLFSKDGDVYRVLPVQMTYVAFGEKHAEYAEAKQVGIALNTETINQRRYIGSQQSKIEQLEKQQRINSECINNLVKQKADYLHKVTMAIVHLDSFDHSRAGMNQLVRSIESALEALRGES